MSRFLAIAAHDVRLQYRYGIYAAYAFVVGFYIVALTLGRGVLPGWAIGVIVYTDPAAVGFFFLGALMMLERSEGVRTALAVSPMTALHYLAGKATTLSGVGLVACVILLAVHQAAPNPGVLLVAVLLTSLCFIGIGVPIALRFRTVNGYLVGSAGFLTPIIAPAFLALLDPMPLWLGVWPPVAQLRLILAGLGAIETAPVEIALCLAVSAAAAVGGLALAHSALKRELGK